MPDPVRAAEAKDFAPPLTLERLLPAPPERVFKAWVDPTTFARWWGPEGFDAPEIALAPEPGGDWRTVLVSPEGTRHIVAGTYQEIDPPNRLVFSWAWEGEDGARRHESEVEITLRPAGSGTHLTLVHRRLESGDSRASHRTGWESSFLKLKRLFA